MSHSKLSFLDALNIIKSARPRANPSWYFKKQLLNFERTNLIKVQSLIPSNLRQSDDYSKIKIENLIIDDKSAVEVKDNLIKNHIKKRNDKTESADLINEIYQVTASVLENGIDFKE